MRKRERKLKNIEKRETGETGEENRTSLARVAEEEMLKRVSVVTNHFVKQYTYKTQVDLRESKAFVGIRNRIITGTRHPLIPSSIPTSFFSLFLSFPLSLPPSLSLSLSHSRLYCVVVSRFSLGRSRYDGRILTCYHAAKTREERVNAIKPHHTHVLELLCVGGRDLAWLHDEDASRGM